MPLSFSAFGRLHWAWSCFTYQPQEWMGHQEVWLRDFAIPNKQCDRKSSYFEERAKLHPFLKMDSTLNFGEWDISTVSEPFISDMQTPPRMVPSFGKLVGCRPKKKELTYKAFNNQKTRGKFYRIRWISSFCHHALEAVLEQQHLVQWDERADYWIDIIIYRTEDLLPWSTRVF